MAKFDSSYEHDPPRNRREWRLNLRQGRRSIDPKAADFNRAIEQYRVQEGIRGSFLQDCDNNIASLVYRGPNLLPLVQATRRISMLLANRKKPYDPESRRSYEHNLKQDDYIYQTSGVSLKDIEILELPLDREAFGKVSRIFRGDKYSFLPPGFRGRSQQNCRVIEILCALAIQPQARDFSVPKDLMGIQQRAEAFFEYAAGYLTHLYPDFDDERNYLASSLTNSRDSIEAVMSYLPGKFGILPRSVSEVLNTKVELSLNGRVWKSYQRGSDLWLKYAYPLGTLGSQNIDPSILRVEDRRPATGLSEALAGSSQGPAEPLDLQQELVNYRQALRAQVLGQRGSILLIEPDDSIIRKLMVGVHNNSAARNYRGTLLLEVFTRRHEDSVVVEMDRTGRIWGIPAEVLKKNPHGDAVLAREILKVLLTHSSETFPVRSQKVDAEYAFPVVEPKPVVIRLEKDLVLQGNRVKTRGIPFVEHRELPEKTGEAKPKAATVNYTRDTITGYLKKVRDEKVTRRIIADISRFEITGQGIYKIEQARRRGLDVFGLRSGDYRVILTCSEGEYRVADILDRSEYNNANLEKLIDSISGYLKK